MRPKLSIITPSLNQGAFIERAICSVLDQGYENLEYFIVDGGSDDDSVEVIKRYQDRIDWWVSEPDQGQTDAINKGLERATGDVVAYLNSDDHYLPGAFDAAIDALEQSGAPWVAGASREVDENDQPVGPEVWRPLAPSVYEDTPKGRHWWMLVPWCVPQPSSFWRRELFEEFGPFRRDMHFAFDAEFMLRLVYGGAMPELLPDTILSARVTHPDQKSSDMSLWNPEMDAFIEIFSPQLTPQEQRRLVVTKGMARFGIYRIRELLWYPLLRLGGRLLGLVPERWRPPIRDRDRHQDPSAPRISASSAIRRR